MKNILVVFENNQHIETSAQKFIDSLGVSVIFDRVNGIIITTDISYKLIGAGFPFHYSIGGKLHRWWFDDVMIHEEVVLTKNVECCIRSRMMDSKEFIYFEV